MKMSFLGLVFHVLATQFGSRASLRLLRNPRGLTYLFISHDFAVKRRLCDRVVIMYLGQRVAALRDGAACRQSPDLSKSGDIFDRLVGFMERHARV
jgi:ABC-type glutathione transport system ATPase component